MKRFLQKLARTLAFFAIASLAFSMRASSARAVDLSTVMFAVPAMVQASESSNAVAVQKSPRRQPFELKRIYHRYRTVFRTVAKGVDLSQELLGGETPGDTFRVRFHPTSANPDRMGGVLSCKFRF